MFDKTVTSLSGGRTSSYMALHFPTDYNIFSLVRIEDKRCAPKDKSLIRYVEDKIGMEFIATAESDLTLYVLRQLEQELGKSITWVTADTFEIVLNYSRHKGSLPNRRMRYCTSDMKMLPIFWYCYLNIMESPDDILEMNIGYRADEPRRGATDIYKYSESCTVKFGFDDEIVKYGNNKWTEIEWRESKFPLRKAGVDNLIVKSFFALKPEYVFPLESNCVGCFNKTEPTLQKQFVYEPEKMNWFKDMEIMTGKRFNISIPLAQIETKDYTYGQQYLFENFTCNFTD